MCFDLILKRIGFEGKPVNSQADGQYLRQLTQPGTLRLGEDSQYLRIFKSNVFVRDLDRSLELYVDQLGFSVVADARFEFGRWVAIAPPDGNTILALAAPKRGSANYKLIGRPTHIDGPRPSALQF
jgi:hypothetical protein